MRRAVATSSRRRASSWGWLVTVSASLIVGTAIAMALWWVASGKTRIATYSVRGSIEAITLDLDEADADIVGGGGRAFVAVRRTDKYAFGHEPIAERDGSGGVLRLRARCRTTMLGNCSSSYRLTVPDNIPVTVRTGAGNVRFTGFRGTARIDTRTGDIAVSEHCGFALRARADTGDVSAATACPPVRLELRSRTGDVRAVVPAGRYRVDADSDEGVRRVRGVTAAEDAPFTIQALSSTGNVDVETGP